MTTFTERHQEKLSAPFDLREHEIREGRGSEWYVYITERPIRRRLSSVDPGWQFQHSTAVIVNPEDGRPYIFVDAALTVLGSTRTNTGTQEAKPKKGGGHHPLDENSVKGAVTDALRRAARQFDVGGYLLDAPPIEASSERDAKFQFADWYTKTFGTDGSGDDLQSVSYDEATGEIVDTAETAPPDPPAPQPDAQPAQQKPPPAKAAKRGKTRPAASEGQSGKSELDEHLGPKLNDKARLTTNIPGVVKWTIAASDDIDPDADDADFHGRGRLFLACGGEYVEDERGRMKIDWTKLDKGLTIAEAKEAVMKRIAEKARKDAA